MDEPTRDPPFPDACRTGRIEDSNETGTVAAAGGTERQVFWTPRRDGA